MKVEKTNLQKKKPVVAHLKLQQASENHNYII